MFKDMGTVGKICFTIIMIGSKLVKAIKKLFRKKRRG